MALDPNRWTLKTQEAFNAAADLAKAENNPEVTPDHLLAALMGQSEGVVLPIVQKVGQNPVSLRNQAAEAISKLPKAYGSDAHMSSDVREVLEAADKERADLGDEYLSTEHLLLALADRVGVSPGGALACPARGAGEPPGHQPHPRGPVPGAREVRHRPHRDGSVREARPRHRPRRGDPPRGAGPLPSDQEQPRPHR